jgi:hypothetical protein
LEFFLRRGGIGVHALHDRIDFASTFGCEFFGGPAKLVGRFAPCFQLGGGLKLKSRLLLLDFLAEVLDVFFDFRLEDVPLRL